MLFFSYPQSFPASGCFPMSRFSASGGQSIGVSASASVLPMNIQGWFPLGLTGLISLQSKGLSRIFSRTIVRKHQFFSLLYGPTLTPIYDYWKNHSFDYTDLYWQSLCFMIHCLDWPKARLSQLSFQGATFTEVIHYVSFFFYHNKIKLKINNRYLENPQIFCD